MSFILTADSAFMTLALAELRRSYAEAHLEEQLVPGVWIVEGDFFTLALTWREDRPIFVRHICPIHITLSLPGTMKDVTLLERTTRHQFADLLDPGMPFSVQTRLLTAVPYKRFRVNVALSDALEQMTGAMLDVRAPMQILSVVIVDNYAYLGLSLADHNLSNWAGGEHRFAREEGQISRAEFKLLEALAAFDIYLPPRGVALDLGAAPGGWTRVLRQQQQYVTAVDPALLHPSLQKDPNIRHKQVTAEAYLGDALDQFDLIVNDMRMDARDSARLMVAYASQLYPQGIAIITLKLPEKGRGSALDHAFNILRTTYHIAGARHLFHNRSEITVYLRKNSSQKPPVRQSTNY